MEGRPSAYSENRITDEQAYERITGPFREFMMMNVREKDLAALSVSRAKRGMAVEEDGRVIFAFLCRLHDLGTAPGLRDRISYHPALSRDRFIVAMLSMSMGMMMLPPTVISLPFKVLFFVLIDGWNLLVGSLLQSFTVP